MNAPISSSPTPAAKEILSHAAHSATQRRLDRRRALSGGLLTLLTGALLAVVATRITEQAMEINIGRPFAVSMGVLIASAVAALLFWLVRAWSSGSQIGDLQRALSQANDQAINADHHRRDDIAELLNNSDQSMYEAQQHLDEAGILQERAIVKGYQALQVSAATLGVREPEPVIINNLVIPIELVQIKQRIQDTLNQAPCRAAKIRASLDLPAIPPPTELDSPHLWRTIPHPGTVDRQHLSEGDRS